MPSIFSRIVAGDIPAYRVWEDDDHFAFLDIAPIRPGHTLVIPKQQVDYLFDMDPAAYAALWQAVRTVEAKLKVATGCKRVIVHVVGYEVPHVHVHLVPTDTLEQYPMPLRAELDTALMTDMANRIANAR